MNTKYFLSLAFLATLLIVQVYCRPQDQVVEVDIVPRQGPINIIPDWITNVLQGSTEAPPPVIPVAGISVTTRRPQLADIIGNGLQGLFQGIVRAPGQIANRVQQIIDGVIRRPSTTTVAPSLLG